MYVEIFFLALALSVDAMIVSFSCGLLIKKERLKNAGKLAAATGIGQMLLPLLGWWATKGVHRYLEQYDHWIAFIVFAALGCNIIYKALRGGDEREDYCPCLNLKFLFLIGLATSIDACVAGISLYFMKVSLIPSVLLIGLVTILNSFVGFYSGRVLKKIPQSYMEIISGLILIALGVKVLFEHLSA